MLLQHSRRDARTDQHGQLVLLADQDGNRWHRAEIEQGLELLAGLPAAPPSAYLVQARIAAEHCRAAQAADTDWPRIEALYRHLDALTDSPVVRLNHAIAVAESGRANRSTDEGGEPRPTDELRTALAMLATVEQPLARYHLSYATSAEFSAGSAGQPPRRTTWTARLRSSGANRIERCCKNAALPAEHCVGRPSGCGTSAAGVVERRMTSHAGGW